MKYFNIESFKIKYPKGNLLVLKILLSLPRILYGIKKEHLQLLKIIKKNKIDLIISDNRYGIYSDKIPSLFISHQIAPKLPAKLKIFEKLVFREHKKRINKFDLCLIPDAGGSENLSGELSHISGLSEKYKYIGILSDFNNETKENSEIIYDMAVILSGPEPQRSILEKITVKQLLKTDYKTVIVSGMPHKNFDYDRKNIRYISHLNRKEMQKLILNSEVVLCRSGYTSIMDLVTLNKKAILIPTPGQTEQEYLAKYLSGKYGFVFLKQDNPDIVVAFEQLKKLEANKNQPEIKNNNEFLKIVKSII